MRCFPAVIFMQIYFLLLPGLKGKLIYSHPIHADCLHLTFTSGTKETCYSSTNFLIRPKCEKCFAFTEKTSICIMSDDLLTVNNDRCIRIIMLLKHFEPELFAIFPFSVADNDGMISSGFVDLARVDPYAMLHPLVYLRLPTNDRKMILNLF